MNDEELIISKLTPAEKWMFVNAQMITNKVLKGGRAAVIEKSLYDPEQEDKLVELFKYLPRVEDAIKTDAGIALVIK